MKRKPILIAGIVVMSLFAGGSAWAQDTTPPQIVSTASLNGQKIGIAFTEALEMSTAQDPLNYSLDNGATVISATLRSDGTNVELEVSGLVSSSYTVTVTGVRDLANNPSSTSANGLVMGMTPEDIGAPAETGSAFTAAPGVIQVRAGGFDTWFNYDSFHYTHQERTGDFDVRVQVKAFGPGGASPSAKALLMVRESADMGSRHISTTVYPSSKNWVGFRRITSYGESSVLAGAWNQPWAVSANYPNAWIRIKRVGETFTTYGSADGDAWIQVGNAVTPSTPYPATVLLGVGATSVGDQFPGSPMVDITFANYGDFSLTNATFQIVQQPSDTTVIENSTATFSVSATTTGTSTNNLSYQWQKDGENIPGATSRSYTTPILTQAANGSHYRVVISLPGGPTVTSGEALLTISNDITPPAILSTSSLNGGKIGIAFDEVLDAASAQDATRYAVNNGAVVTSATLRPNGTSVELEVSGLTGTNYTVTAIGVRDLVNNSSDSSASGVVMGLTSEDIGSPSEAGSAFTDAAGSIEVRAGGADVWFNNDSFHFTHLEKTGDFDFRTQVASFGPSSANANAKALLMVRESAAPGSRHVSITVYPTLANWTSYYRTTTDGATAVLDGSWRIAWPAGVNFPNAWIRIKRVGETFTTYGSTDGDVWTQIGNAYTPAEPFPQTILLGAAASSLGDQFIGAPMIDVGFANFGDFALTNAVVTFTRQPTNATVVENVAVTFSATVAVTGTSASNLSYQWLRDGSPIPGATSAAYTLAFPALADSNAHFRLRVSLPGGATYLSDEVVLTVNQDTQPPAIVSVSSLDSQTIGVRFNEVVNSAVAQDLSHYTLGGGAVVTQATLMPDGKTVVLAVSGLVGNTFQLQVNGILDIAGNQSDVSAQGAIQNWTVADIGSPAEPGSAFSMNPGDIDVRAGGTDIWGAADSFNYVYQQRTGDFDVAVQMTRLDFVTFSTRGGLMVREDLSPGSRNLFVGTYPENGQPQWVASVRSVTDGGTTLAAGNSFISRVDFAFPNAWFRVKRAGNTFTAYYSTNGVDWAQLADQLTPETPYPDTVYLGLGTVTITSDAGTATIAQYRNFGEVKIIAVPELAIAHSGGNVTVSWPTNDAAFNLQTTTNLMGIWSAIATAPTVVGDRNQVTLPATDQKQFYRLQK